MAMADDESIDDFHSRLINMTDEFGRLGDPFAEHTIVKKFLRALLLSFQDKVTVIEEFRNLNTYPLNELLGNLQAYEMRIKERKLKSIASSVVRKEEKKTKEAVEENDSDLEFTAKEFALLFKQYEKFISSNSTAAGGFEPLTLRREQGAHSFVGSNGSECLFGASRFESTSIEFLCRVWTQSSSSSTSHPPTHEIDSTSDLDMLTC
ncbi:hypothetical protein ACLB2K_035520 [Fragaria x ananassa]